MQANVEPASLQGASLEVFRTRKQALDWLREQGVRVSQGKFYQDCDAGLVAVYPDKTVSKFAVSQYLLGLQRQVAPDVQAMDRQGRKEQLDIELKEMELAKRRLEYRAADAEWLRTEDAWAAVAALLGSVLDGLRYHFHKAAPELVHLAGGDPARAAEVYEQCEQVMGLAMAEIGPRIDGVFAEEGTDEQ